MRASAQKSFFSEEVGNGYPREVQAKAPPIKSQGIKTKLVPTILRSFRWDGNGTWVEPFVGSGAVAFNSGAKNVLAADTNRHLIRFYKAVQDRTLDKRGTRTFLESEGARLEQTGEDHYYAIRDRFNKHGDPLDFLFLSRSCFNGMIRFNAKGGYNVPFCRKPNRFRPALITKIVNQVEWLEGVIREANYLFLVQDWRETLNNARANDLIYVDPPYVGRHTDYFNSWDEEEADALAQKLQSCPSRYVYSMWYKNQYRENEHLKRWFADHKLVLVTHFYHVGATEDLRNEMEEAIVVSPNAALTSS